MGIPQPEPAFRVASSVEGHKAVHLGTPSILFQVTPRLRHAGLAAADAGHPHPPPGGPQLPEQQDALGQGRRQPCQDRRVDAAQQPLAAEAREAPGTRPGPTLVGQGRQDPEVPGEEGQPAPSTPVADVLQERAVVQEQRRMAQVR